MRRRWRRASCWPRREVRDKVRKAKPRTGRTFLLRGGLPVLSGSTSLTAPSLSRGLSKGRRNAVHQSRDPKPRAFSRERSVAGSVAGRERDVV